MRATKKSNRVYSTESGRICPGCQRPKADCVCKSTHPTLKSEGSSDGIVRLHRETKGRSGKGVTLVKGLDVTEADLTKLAKQLKTKCGIGGSIKAGVIELQSSDRDKIKKHLEQLGFAVKIAGG